MKKAIKITAIVLAIVLAYVGGCFVEGYIRRGREKTSEEKNISISVMTNQQYFDYCESEFDKVYKNNKYETDEDLSKAGQELFLVYQKLNDELKTAELVDESGNASLYSLKHDILEETMSVCTRRMWMKNAGLSKD